MSLLDKIWEKLASSKNPSQPDPQPSKLLKENGEGGPYGDLEAIRKCIKTHIDDCSNARWAFERNWFKSILYYVGNQWITWEKGSRRFKEKRLRKWVPKPVTNRYASTLSSVISAVQTFKVLPSVWPATADAEDVATANVADRMIPVIEDEININKVRRSAANWVVLNADAFAFPHYDLSDTSLGNTKIQSFRCTACQEVAPPKDFEEGVCPSCQQPAMTEPAIDEAGMAIETEYPVGRLAVDIYSPLEVYLNLDLPDLSKHKEFTIAKSFSLKTIKETWPESGQNVSADKQGATKSGQQFMQALAHMTEDGGYYYGKPSGDIATLYTHIKMPNSDYPEGLCVTMSADETILEVGPSPFYDEVNGQRTYYNPLVHIPYEPVPGRLYAKTPAYDLMPKQDQLNRLESLIEMSVMKGVYNTWLLPTGSSISNIAGEPGQMIRWTPTGTNGAKPEVVGTQPFPAILLEWKKQIEGDFEEIAGTFDAMKGNVPRGVSAGYAIQLLTERSYGRFGPVFEGWEAGWTQIYNILLKLARVYWTEDRLRKIKGASGKWEIENFKGADLNGSIDVKIDGGSSRPRSKLSEQALVESLTKMGVINPQDPKQQFQIAELFGMQHVLGGIDCDRREAAREWDAFQKWDRKTREEGPQVHKVYDNHVVHIMDHQEQCKTDSFRELPDEVQQVWEQHILQHMQEMAPPPGPPQPGQQPGDPTSKANENGDPTMSQVREGGSPSMGAGG